MIITHVVLDLTVQRPLPLHTWDLTVQGSPPPPGSNPLPFSSTWDLFVQGPPGPTPPPQPNMEPHCAGIPVLLTSGDHQ